MILAFDVNNVAFLNIALFLDLSPLWDYLLFQPWLGGIGGGGNDVGVEVGEGVVDGVNPAVSMAWGGAGMGVPEWTCPQDPGL